MGAGLVLDSRYIDQADNTAVSTWSDRSGNGWDASQATPASRPTYEANEIGGNGVVRFDGSNDFMTVSGAVGLLKNVGGATLFVVAQYNAVSDGLTEGSFFFSRNGNSQSTRAFIGILGNAGFSTGGRRLDTDGFQTTSSTYTSGRTVLHTGLFDYANSDLFLFLDGSQTASNTNFQAAGNTSNTDSDAVRVGASATTGFDQYFQGDMGQAIAFPSALTASQRKRVEHSAARSFKLSCN